MIDLQGWMYWLPTERSSILSKPSWKRKWIVLTPDAIFIYKTDTEGTNPPVASYSLASFEKCLLLEATRKSPSAISLIPHPNQVLQTASRSSNSSSSSTSSFLRKTSRRQSTPSSPTVPLMHTPLTSTPITFRAEQDSPISLHEWQRSINDRLKSPFSADVYQPPPQPAKVPYGTVNMYNAAPPLPPNPNRNTITSSPSHKSLSQSVTSNLSAALSSVTSPSSRRKSRTLSPSEMKRVRDADQASVSSSDGFTPPATSGVQQGYFDEEVRPFTTAEKVLEQAMRFHHQRRTQQRFGGPRSMKSNASIGSGNQSDSASPVQLSPAITAISTLPPTRTNVITPPPPNMSIASLDVLIKELEDEEEERKRQRQLPVAAPFFPPPTAATPEPVETEAKPQPRPRRPSAINAAKRRSTGSILLNHQPLTPTFTSFDKENAFPFIDHKPSAQSRRVSVASFGSQHSESQRNSAHEVNFNLVDWNTLSGGLSAAERRASRELNAIVRTNSVVSSIFGEVDESRRSPSYNFGRRGSVY